MRQLQKKNMQIFFRPNISNKHCLRANLSKEENFLLDDIFKRKGSYQNCDACKRERGHFTKALLYCSALLGRMQHAQLMQSRKSVGMKSSGEMLSDFSQNFFPVFNQIPSFFYELPVSNFYTFSKFLYYTA